MCCKESFVESLIDLLTIKSKPLNALTIKSKPLNALILPICDIVTYCVQVRYMVFS